MVELPGFALAIYMAPHFSRKTCMLLSLLAMLTSTLMFSFARMRLLQHELGAGLELLAQIGLVGHKISISFGFLIVYVYTVEIYPTVARTLGGSFCIAAGRLGAMAAPSVYENLEFITGSSTAFFN